MEANTLSNTDKLLTLTEAADYMRVSKMFIWHRRKEGKLVALRAGKKVLFHKSTIDSFLRGNNQNL